MRVAAMNVTKATISKLTLSIAILAQVGCSLPDSRTVSDLAQTAVREAGLMAQGWIVRHSKAEPLCPLCIRLVD